VGKTLSKNENQGSENLNKDLDNKSLTVKEVANILDETPNVVRNWLKELKPYIPLKKNSNGYNVFDHEALEQMKLIKQLHREQNYSIKQIEHYFATGGESYKPIPQKGTDEILAEELRLMREEIQSLREHSEKQEEFNHALIQRLDEQQQYIDNKLEVRDQLLMESMRETLENRKKEIAAASEQVQEQKKGFWQRLFGK
jgi:DNA-binding transcriptional MerR regulator